MAKRRPSIKESNDIAAWVKDIVNSDASQSEKDHHAFALVMRMAREFDSGDAKYISGLLNTPAGILASTRRTVRLSKWEYYGHNPHAQDCCFCRKVVRQGAPICFTREARKKGGRGLGAHPECYRDFEGIPQTYKLDFTS